MVVEPLRIPDVLLIKPRIFRDNRGHFLEVWRESLYAERKLGPFVQDNASVSKKDVLRGIHFQHPEGQGKLVGVLRGRVLDVAVDVRLGSPTFGKWVGAELSDDNGHQLFIPEGFAHGFVTRTDDVVLSYKCTRYYNQQAERTIRWDDPQVAVDWQCPTPILASKDAAAPLLSELPKQFFPAYRGA